MTVVPRLARLPGLANQLRAPLGSNFQAAIFERRRSSVTMAVTKSRGVNAPTGLVVLMSRKSTAAGHLEVDCVFEQHYLLAGQVLDPTMSGPLRTKRSKSSWADSRLTDLLSAGIISTARSFTKNTAGVAGWREPGSSVRDWI